MRDSAESVPHGGLGKHPPTRMPSNAHRRVFFEGLLLVALMRRLHKTCFVFFIHWSERYPILVTCLCFQRTVRTNLCTNFARSLMFRLTSSLHVVSLALQGPIV